MNSATNVLRKEREIVHLCGRDYEVVFRFKCGKVPADYVLPNGRLDLTKYEPLKGILARFAASQSAP